MNPWRLCPRLFGPKSDIPWNLQIVAKRPVPPILTAKSLQIVVAQGSPSLSSHQPGTVHQVEMHMVTSPLNWSSKTKRGVQILPFFQAVLDYSQLYHRTKKLTHPNVYAKEYFVVLKTNRSSLLQQSKNQWVEPFGPSWPARKKLAINSQSTPPSHPDQSALSL